MTHQPATARRPRILSGRPSRWCAGVAAASILASPVLLAQTPRAQRERHVYISAAGKDDAPVTDLAPAEIRVREDGMAREVLRVGQATTPMQIALLVDDSDVSQRAVTEIREGVSAFIKQILDGSSQTEITLMTFGDRPTTLVPATSSAVALAKGVEKIFWRKGSGAYLMQAIDEAAKTLKKKGATRPVIVAFDMEDGPEFSNDSNDSIRKTLQNTGVALWTVTLLEQRGAVVTPEARERAIVVSDVASDSGGGNKPLITRQAITLGLSWVATRLLSQLDVTYNRPEALIPPKQMEVEVTRKDVKLWAPRWGKE
ncbi:MAG TPA: VWA domain-containing protein [Vicinamibacterales bacterium]|nr:VWA domain-containing protein [Vicinamibacterales bacterium]